MPDSNPSPLVSLVVVNWNGGQMLHDCMASLLGQTWPRLEILLVDNGSQGAEVEEIRRRYGSCAKLILNGDNEGFARGNNQAFEAASGDWLCIFNNDTVVDARCVEELMNFASDHHDAGMLACRVMRLRDPHIIDSTGLLLYPDGISRCRGWEEKDLGQYDRPAEVLAPHGCAAAYRRTMLSDVGGFDEDYFCYLEDADLGIRAQLAGWRCWYVPEARVQHRKSETAGNHSRFKAYYVERNRIWLAVKLLPRFVLLMNPLFTLNRYLLQGYAAATHKGIPGDFVRDYSYLDLVWILARAYGAALLGVPRMLAKRREISRKRRLTTEQLYRLISRSKLDAIELALKD